MLQSPAAIFGLVLCLLGPAAKASESTSEEPEEPSRWLETTSLDRNVEPGLNRGAATASLELAPGRWMLCTGGEDVAIRCDARLVEGEPLKPPEPQPGTVVTGTVLVGGRVAPEARVSVTLAGLASRRPFAVPLLWDPDEETLVREVHTGNDGKFRIPALAPGDYLLEIVPKGGRIQTTPPFSLPTPETLLARDQDPAEVQAVWDLGELALDAGMTVEILVTDTTGAPLPQGKAGGRQGEAPDVVFFEADADTEGKIRLSGLDPTLPVHIVCVADGYARMSGTFEVPPSATHCAMEALAGARGRVLEQNEEPVAEATITLLGSDGSATHTNGEGDFHFEKLVAGDYELEISAPGFRIATVEVSLDPGTTAELEPVYLRRGDILRGQVVEGLTGEPLSGATVTVTEPPGGASTVSDGDGLFELQADPDHPPVLRIEASGFPVHRKQAPGTAFEEGEPVVVEIRPGGRIEVIAWAEGGEGPCAGCEFLVNAPGDGWHRLKTDSTGWAQGELLPAGRYWVQRQQASSTGSVVFVSSGSEGRWATVVAGETTTVEFGEPTVPLEVRFRPAPPGSWDLWAEGPDWQRRAEALGNGAFVFRRPSGEPVELGLRAPDGGSFRAASVPADFDREVFEARLPAGRVVGNLVHDDGPVEGLAIAVVGTHQGDRRATVRSGKGGVFEIPFLAPGTYLLTVEGQAVRTFSVVDGGEVVLEQVTVGSAQDTGPIGDLTPP